MKIFIILAPVLALVLGKTIATMRLSEPSLVDPENIRVQKLPNFDEEIQKLNLTSFRALLVQAKLFDTLNDPTKSYTVFAPTNAAIANSPKGLLDNATRLPEILKYHVHFGAFRTSMISKNMRLKTLLGGQQKIRFEFYSGVIYGSCQPLGNVLDQTYDNGILDELNGIMVPPEGDFLGIISQATTFQTLLKYVSKATLKPFLQKQEPMTFLAPNDVAFKKLAPDVIDKLNNDIRFLHKVLEYHFLTDIYCSAFLENGQELETYEGATVKVQVSGGKVVINNSTVIQADTIAYNGVFYVIDTVLLPPSISA